MKKYKKTLDNICYITYIDKADESENFEIVFYKKRGGQCPIQEFLDSLDVKMRAKQGSNITRLLYFFFAGKKAVLTNGFVKKTQKTPRAQIQKAKEYRSDYLAQIQTED